MSLLKVKLDVYPLENYVQNATSSSAEAGSSGFPTNSSANQKLGHHSGGKDGETRRHKTPLDKLMSLKTRCIEEQCVQSVEAVLIVHVHRHPHVLLMKQPQFPSQQRQQQGGRSGPGGGCAPQRVLAGQAAAAGGAASFLYRLPGGRCRRGETEEACLHRKLGRQLLNEAKQPAGSSSGGGSVGGAVSGSVGTASETIVDVGAGAAHTSEATSYFRVGEVLAKWYRPHFSPLMYPYVPPHISLNNVKEVRTVYLIHLEPVIYFNLYRADTELIAVPLFDLYENTAKYGPIAASLPTLLSRVMINHCSAEY